MADEVRPFLGLKQVPCPKEAGGGICTNTGCLFGHKADENHTRPKPANTQPDGPDINKNATSDEVGGAVRGRAASESDTATDLPPSKRQKTSAASQASGTGDDQGGGYQLANGGSISKPAASTGASDTYDPLSPPSATGSSSIKSLKHVSTTGVIKTAAKAATAAAASPSVNDGRTAPTPNASLNSIAKPQPSPQIPLSSSAFHSSNSSTSRPSSSNLPNPASARNGASQSLLGGTVKASSSAAPPANSSSVTPKTSPLVQGPSASTPKPASQAGGSKPAQKAETLNPRHITPSPAGHIVRYKLLIMLHTEFTRLNTAASQRSIKEPDLKPLLMNEQQLIQMALDREVNFAIKNSSIYRNSMTHEVQKYRKMQLDAWVGERKLAVAQNKPVQQKSDLGIPVVIETGLRPSQEVEILSRIITPTENLDAFGYVNSAPTDEKIAEMRQVVDWSKGWEQCDRCGGRFQVHPGRNIETGELTSGGKCTHHSGRLYWPERPKNSTGQVPKKYRCCNEDEGESPGCTVGETHVWKASAPERLALLWNFAPTPANDSPDVKKAVAFDCEMGFTAQGMEVIRLTVTSWPDGGEVLDILVQPFGEILDLNSRYSGVFPEDMIRAIPWTNDGKPPLQKAGERKILQKVATPKAARDLFFSFINRDTVLIGHGLENDLNAMRMIHPKIVDTILLYPHNRGLPVRNSLKYLMQSHLNRKIQVDIGEGHDSAEDAKAAGDLVRFKVQKEWNSMRYQGWRLLDGVFCAPGHIASRDRSSEQSATEPNLKEYGSKESLGTEESVDTEEGGASLLPDQVPATSS